MEENQQHYIYVIYSYTVYCLKKVADIEESMAVPRDGCCLMTKDEMCGVSSTSTILIRLSLWRIKISYLWAFTPGWRPMITAI